MKTKIKAELPPCGDRIGFYGSREKARGILVAEAQWTILWTILRERGDTSEVLARNFLRSRSGEVIAEALEELGIHSAVEVPEMRSILKRHWVKSRLKELSCSGYGRILFNDEAQT